MKNIWGGVQFADMVKGNRVRPWMRDEHILVDGFELVYTVHKGKEEGLCVHMPGGRRETIESLREQGFVVSMPKLMRFFRPVLLSRAWSDDRDSVAAGGHGVAQDHEAWLEGLAKELETVTEIEVMRLERDSARAHVELLVKTLVGIHQLLYPPVTRLRAIPDEIKAAEAAASEAPSLPFDGPTFGRFNKETS